MFPPIRTGKKTLDLALPLRLSGLAPGAKLELVFQSRSPSVVSIALQLPDADPDAQGIPQGRMTAKFASTTSLWGILRAFEAGAAGGLGVTKNFTQRGIPRPEGGKGTTAGMPSGSGRLCYEEPVVNVMGRTQSGFSELQKTLAQVGLKNGTALLRLSFRATDTPLEDAMTEIEEHFRTAEEHSGGAKGAEALSVPAVAAFAPDGASGPAMSSFGSGEASKNLDGFSQPLGLTQEKADVETEAQVKPMGQTSDMMDTKSESPVKPDVHASDIMDTEPVTYPSDVMDTEPDAPIEPAAHPSDTVDAKSEMQTEHTSPEIDTTTAGPESVMAPPNKNNATSSTSTPSTAATSRPLTVIAPPTSAAPQAYLENHNPSDYEHTLTHIKQHQARLQSAGTNRRLPNHSEEAANKQARAQKLAKITSLELKIRFPDQTAVVTTFGAEDTPASVYAFVVGLLVDPNVPFLLNYQGDRGVRVLEQTAKVRLISGLGLVGRVMVNFVWAEGAGAAVRKAQLLKTGVREKAREVEVPVRGGIEGDVGEGNGGEGKKDGKKPDGGASGEGKSRGMPKWLKLPGKK
jgi:tether containing UBX domain for GLUT4